MYTPPANATFFSWKAEPYVRGTSSILTSCLITLTLCVWTAVHLNIPKYQKASQATWRKVAWLITAMLAPELVALAAFCQYREATALGKRVRKVYGQKEPSFWSLSTSKRVTKLEDDENGGSESEQSRQLQQLDATETKRRRHPWTRTHSFYALMGGFAIDTRRCEKNFLSHGRNRMILNPVGFTYLLEHEPDLLPDLSLEEIQDKSKASNIAKTIVCCQAIWFCAQCCARWYADIGFSLLELNTLAHCICALLIFMLWWKKPLDVDSPTLINAEDMMELAGFMALCSYSRSSQKSRWRWRCSHPRLKLIPPGYEYSLPESCTGEVILQFQDREEPQQVGDSSERYEKAKYSWSPWFGSRFSRKYNTVASGIPEQERLRLMSNRTFGSFQYLGPCAKHDDTPRAAKKNIATRRTHVHKLVLNEADQYCWLLASKSLTKYDTLLQLDQHTDNNLEKYLTDCNERMLVDRVGDIPRIETLSGVVVVATLAIAGFIYGGVHLAAWNTMFRTKMEEYLWKISAISLAASGPMGVCVIFIFRSWNIEREDDMSLGRFLLTSLLMFILPAVGVVYVVARVYLIVESFLNLTYLEASIFVVPNWLQYFPHIT
ncbi:hypothetical protein ACET3X_002353 [Alternaria dauci]|uniref:Uncharacterized protein n=1 Tax=Alternaria dauci TaxID=48095 RepID=A0ABR3UPA8_9PLEO